MTAPPPPPAPPSVKKTKTAGAKKTTKKEDAAAAAAVAPLAPPHQELICVGSATVMSMPPLPTLRPDEVDNKRHWHLVHGVHVPRCSLSHHDHSSDHHLCGDLYLFSCPSSDAYALQLSSYIRTYMIAIDLTTMTMRLPAQQMFAGWRPRVVPLTRWIAPQPAGKYHREQFAGWVGSLIKTSMAPYMIPYEMAMIIIAYANL